MVIILLNEGKPVEARKMFEAIEKKQYVGLSSEQEAILRGAQQSAQLAIARTYVQEQNNAEAQLILNKLLAANNVQPNVQMAAQKLLQSLT